MINETLDVLYVKSTTHAQLIKTISSNNKIIHYLFEDLNSANAFRVFKNKENDNFIILPNNNLLKFIKLLIILMSLKIQKKKIIFFFECCNFQFDFLINIINCKGYFCPFDLGYRSTMFKIDNFLKFDKINLFKKIYYIILRHVSQKKINFYYRYKFDGIAIYPINFKYPKNIKDLSYKKFLSNRKKLIFKKKIIFIFHNIFEKNAYKEFRVKFDSDFLQLIDFLKKKDVQLYFKDHPNKLNRLNANNHGLINLDNNIPCELLDDDYFLAIGFSSCPLLNFYYGRSVSLIDMYTDHLSARNIDIHERFFKSWSSHFDVDLFRPKDMDALKDFINKRLDNL